MKITATALLLITLAVLTFTLYYPSTKNTDTLAVTHAESNGSADIPSLIRQNATYRNKIKELEQENRNLQQRLSALEPGAMDLRAIEDTGASVASLPLTDQTDPRQPTNFTGELERHQKNVVSTTELTAYLSTFSDQSPADINRDLNEKFNAEPVDHLWASDHERKLGQLFTEGEKLSEFVPESISCKTTRCRVTVPVSSYEESNRIMDNVAHSLANNSVGLEETMVITIPNPSTGFVDFYIGRNSDVKPYQ